MVSATKIFLTLAMAMNTLAFHYRVYSNGGCDHDSRPSETWPPNNAGPIPGAREGICYRNPNGTDWNRLEIDERGGRAIITYRDVGCKGGALRSRGGNCFQPPVTCAIGSFAMAP